RAQQYRLQQRVVGALPDCEQQLRVVGSGRIVAAAERERAAGEKLLELRELLGCRAFVHAVERRMLRLGVELGRADVRRQHAFLYELVRLVARRRHDADDLSGDVELELQLDRVEVDRAALFARFRKRKVERVQ